MKVLVVEPQKPCRVQEIDGLAAMQQIVGGDIEAVYPFQDSAALVCNAEGKLQRYKSLYDNVQVLPVRTATREQGRIVGDQHIKKKGKSDHER